MTVLFGVFFFYLFLKVFVFVLCVFKAFSHSLILFRFKFRAKVRVKVKLGLGLGSAKVECTMYSESGLVPSPSLFQNHVLTGVASFEVYVSDVIGRRFEKVKNGHIYENWMPI